MIHHQAIARQLAHLFGRAESLEAVNSTLKSAVRNIGHATVGGYHITCSDETEQEAIRSFDHSFAQDLLPRLKFGHHAPFRSANLGGQYEWGAVRLAENHFAAAAPKGRDKVLVVKASAHVGCSSHRRHGKNVPRYGILDRYGEHSACCGLLAAAIAGDPLPAAAQMRQALRSEGIDRIATLSEHIDDDHRALCAAIVAARIQARKIVLDLQDYSAVSPTLHLIVPTVTLNRPDRDRELVCGLYLIDHRGDETTGTYQGLGDRPELLEIVEHHGHLRITDPTLQESRAIRDHRAMIGDAYRRVAPADLGGDHRVQEIARAAKLGVADKPATVKHEIEKTALRGLLLVLAELAPVPAALYLFGEGAAGIFHAWSAHRIARDPSQTEDARLILDDLHQRVDRLPPAQAAALLDSLLNELQTVPSGSTG